MEVPGVGLLGRTGGWGSLMNFMVAQDCSRTRLKRFSWTALDSEMFSINKISVCLHMFTVFTFRYIKGEV